MRRRDATKHKKPIKDENGQLIYTFRENNDSIEPGDETFERNDESFRSNNYQPRPTKHKGVTEKTVRMKKSDFFPDGEKHNTITRNGGDKILAQTLMSLNNGTQNFSTTGKGIEVMSKSDLSTAKSMSKHTDSMHESKSEMKHYKPQNRSASHKRISKTDRRDGVKPKYRKYDTCQTNEDLPETIEIHLLRRHNHKLKKYYKGILFPHNNDIDKLARQYTHLSTKVKHLEDVNTKLKK